MELKARIEHEFLPYVAKPTRYLGNEYNSVTKSLDAVPMRTALCFPDLYETGIRNVSFELLYHLLNHRQTVWAERCYAPWGDAEAVLRERGIPLVSLESKTPLSGFDLVVVFTHQDLAIPTILTMLDLGGIPLRSGEREAGTPLVAACGPAINNPEPLAPFLDLAVIGEPDQALLDLCERVETRRGDGLSRRELLRDLATLPGIYVPALYSPRISEFGEYRGLQPDHDGLPARIAKRESAGDGSLVPLKPLVPTAEFGQPRHTFEEPGGFTSAEKSFAASRLWAPLSRRQLENLFWESQKIWRQTEGSQVSALMQNDAAYTETFWATIKERGLLEGQKIQFAPSALRLMLARTELADFAAALKQSGFAFSPVAGSYRLRQVCNINLRDDELLDVLKVVLERGWAEIRLNFMVGLPTEKEADIIAIIALVRRCLEAGAAYPDTRWTVSLQGFSPRAHTPFQWEGQAGESVIRGRIERVRAELADTPVRLHVKDPHTTALETAFSRGGREMADVAEAAWRRGARFDHLDEAGNAAAWREAFGEAGVDREALLAPLSITVSLPWDHIDVGAGRTGLKAEKLEAFAGKVRPENRGMVSVGYGVPRAELENFLRNDPALQQDSTSTGGAVAAVPVSYGRRGRRRQSSAAAVIKRRVRVRYAKSGPARFLSQADVIRVFGKSAQLAGVPLVLSQSFRQIPKIAYGSPLPPGVASSAEYLDMEVELGREIDLQAPFNRHLPAGIQILQYRGILAGTPALAATVNRAVYEVLVEDLVIPEDWIDELLNRSEVSVVRETRDEGKAMDIRPFIRGIRFDPPKLVVTADAVEGRTARVTEILEALFSPHDIDYRRFPVQRTGQFIVSGDTVQSPMEVA